MLEGAVGSRYAGALFEIAERDGIIDKLEQELDNILGTIKGARDLEKVMFYSQVDPSEKKAVLKSIFKDQISGLTFNFLFLLIDKQREAFLDSIVSTFKKLAYKARNAEQVQVTSAVELNEKEKADLEKSLEKLTGKKVQSSYSVDPLLIGGVMVRIGDRIIDGSVRNKLASVREHLRQIS